MYSVYSVSLDNPEDIVIKVDTVGLEPRSVGLKAETPLRLGWDSMVWTAQFLPCVGLQCPGRGWGSSKLSGPGEGR